jgi:hypothetical protein
MKNALSTVFALFALANVGLAADNTLGTWKYNTAKSKPASGMSRIKDLTVTREAAGDAVKVSAKGEREDGSKIDSTTTLKYDGKDVEVTGSGVTWDTTSAKQVNANTLTETRSKKDGKYQTTVRTSVSKDGKTMTSTSKGTNADGKPFTSVAVFDKQ